MRFWDSSAVVPLVLREKSTPVVSKLLSEDADIIAWWGTSLEATSAIARLKREALLTPDKLHEAIASLDRLLDGATIIQPASDVLQTAKELLLAHTLRAADALQLAAALTAAGGPPEGRGFVCLDDRLRTAARAEGFSVYPP